jgi:hypothetical protein
MTTPMFKTLAVLAVAFGAVALGAGCNLEHDAATKPTYEADVRPILMARCVRCHGAPPLGDPESSTLFGTGSPPPASPRFDVYGDTNCDGTDAGICVKGAASAAGLMKMRVTLPQEMSGMPPLPAPALTSYQRDTIVNWADEATPTTPPLEK